MALTKLLLWLLLVIVAVLVGVGVAILQHRKSPKSRTRTRKPAPVESETVYSELGDSSDSTSLDMDPLAEAEVYLAYGNKNAALRVLIQAAQATPRADLLAKIQEIRASDRRV